MIRIPHKHQMYAEATVANRVGPLRHAPAAHELQGGVRVHSVGHSLSPAAVLSVDYSNLTHLAGLRPGPFSSFTHPLAGLSLQRQRCHGRQVERIAPCRFRVRNSHSLHHIACKLTDAAKSHVRHSVVAGFDSQQRSERPDGTVPNFKAELPNSRGELPHVCR